MASEKKIIVETIETDESKTEILDVSMVDEKDNKKLIIENKYQNMNKKNNAFNVIEKDGKMSIQRNITEADISLFKDERWVSAKENMSEEDRDHYKNIGEISIRI
jgi:hypothetical protein